MAARNRNLRPLALAVACGVNYGVAAFLIKLLTAGIVMAAYHVPSDPPTRQLRAGRTRGWRGR